jgi:hypothetical protein
VVALWHHVRCLGMALRRGELHGDSAPDCLARRGGSGYQTSIKCAEREPDRLGMLSEAYQLIALLRLVDGRRMEPTGRPS